MCQSYVHQKTHQKKTYERPEPWSGWSSWLVQLGLGGPSHTVDLDGPRNHRERVVDIMALRSMVTAWVVRSHLVFQHRCEFVKDVQVIKLMQCNSAFDHTKELKLHMVEKTIVVWELSLPANSPLRDLLSSSRPADLPLRRALTPSALGTTAAHHRTCYQDSTILRCFRVPPEAIPEPHLDRRDDILITNGFASRSAFKANTE